MAVACACRPEQALRHAWACCVKSANSAAASVVAQLGDAHMNASVHSVAADAKLLQRRLYLRRLGRLRCAAHELGQRCNHGAGAGHVGRQVSAAAMARAQRRRQAVDEAACGVARRVDRRAGVGYTNVTARRGGCADARVELYSTSCCSCGQTANMRSQQPRAAHALIAVVRPRRRHTAVTHPGQRRAAGRRAWRSATAAGARRPRAHRRGSGRAGARRQVMTEHGAAYRAHGVVERVVVASVRRTEHMAMAAAKVLRSGHGRGCMRARLRRLLCLHCQRWQRAAQHLRQLR
mmetsp:Transcript_10916/g.32463  ORF Transcript_10916/g.32463 Transcript_10916/m.32463 type:complete len:292 (+) Transcript_10916:517-1392(+)|eukprot:354857-Chlamydomonas_euryale.AAC.38